LLIWSREVRKTHDDAVGLVDDVAVQVTNAITPRLDHAPGDPLADGMIPRPHTARATYQVVIVRPRP
jgi:hypothetical protein